MNAQVSTAQIKAVVVGDIPAHRLLWLRTSEDGKTLRIGLPRQDGYPVDFVSTRELKDGEEVTVTIKGDPIWLVEAAETLKPGQNVYVDSTGRLIGSHGEHLHSVGYVLEAAQKGDIVRMVRNYKFYSDRLPLDESQEE